MIEMEERFEVVVAGGGTAGWMAALSAAREGRSTLLIERKGYCGGVLGTGLSIYGFHDVSHRQVVKGYAEEFVSRLTSAGGSDGYTLLDLWHASMVSVDAAVVKPVIFELLHEAGVQARLYSQVVDVVRDGRRIDGLLVQEKSGRRLVRGNMFIDASGDAVIAHLAGLPVETCDEQQPPTLVLRLENFDLEALRSHLLAHPEDFVNWRMLPGRSVDAEFIKRSVKFMIMPGLVEEFRHAGEYSPLINRIMFTCTPGSSGVTVNMLRARAADGTDSRSLSRASFDVYRNVLPLVEFFRARVPGFKSCRLVDCEPELQLRETRRIAGEYALQAEDVLNKRFFEDTVALGGYFIDIHGSKDTGGKWVMTPGAFGIPYRALVARGADNLLAAGRCISGTKEAAAAYRVMATSMAMGQAAGVAAALNQDGAPAAGLPYKKLSGRLRATGMVLS